MSFARAKRFVYKEPEIKVSPADYDVPCSLGKVFTSSTECQGYYTKNAERSSLAGKQLSCRCRRNPPITSNTRNGSSYNERNFRRGLKACSTPDKKKINITDSDKIKERESIFTRSDTKRISFREKNSSYIQNTDKNIEYKQNGSNRLNDIKFCTIEEFFDDDYHSYTSSEDIRNTEKSCVKHYTDSSRSNFEKKILDKIDHVSRDINNLHNSFKEFKDDLLVNQCQNKLNKIGNTTNHTITPTHRYNYKSQLSDKIQNEIYNAIENLKTEFSSQQNSIIRDAILKIGSIAGDMYSNRERCNIQIEDLCYKIVSDLNKNILNLVDEDRTLEFETSLQSDMELKEIDAILNPDNHFFYYEDICKTLTNHLQISQKELDDLKKDKTEIMIKSCNAHKEINNQTSVLRKLQEELTILKNSFK
ncbi:unnamed protein product [Diabrotica balteata]|uniref:Uncharacterized protein n=1 Tax=Diabrotica balteata TaxID=107213 RepID=A0A9N9T3N3_DIABA|nr:unnamed protein product [Diabrotica balteata]